MDLRQLKYFLAVADARSFAKAANSLYISRPAISKAISLLESDIGADLFVRDSKGVFLTPTGIKLYDKVRNPVMDIEHILTDLHASGTRYRQLIRVGFSQGLLHLFEDKIISFSLKNSNIKLEYSEIQNADCIKELLDRKADITIGTTQPQISDINYKQIAVSSLGLLIRKTKYLPSYGTITMQDLKWLPLAIWNDEQIEKFTSSNSLVITQKSNDPYRLYKLAQTGQYGIILPKILAPQEWDTLYWLPIENNPKWEIYLMHLASLDDNIIYRTTLDELENYIVSDI